jgi:DNA-binding transcriptional LysR family regulator
VALTDAGVLLARHAQVVLDRLAAAKADLNALGSGVVGTLRIGTFQSAGTHIVPGALRYLSARWPRIEVQLVESNDDDHLLHLVECGDLDVAFYVLPVREGPFEIREVLTDPFVLAVPPDSPLADQAVATLDDLEGVSLIGLAQCDATEHAERYLEQCGINRHVLFRSRDNETVRRCVAAGIGAALVPSLVVEQGSGTSAAVLDIDADIPPRKVVLVSHRDRLSSPSTDGFIEAVAHACSLLSRT